MTLRDELVAAGLNVQTVTGWGSRGGKWALGKPIAVMEHHTAPPVPFPVSALYGDLLKCNINVKPDGTVWLIAQGACNYSSGQGSSVVLSEAKAGQPPTENARERGLADDVGGNAYFFNFENDHKGDGSPIPKVQHDAIVTATRVVLDYYGLKPGNVISHAEWTTRKRDPYWNGSLRAIEAIREQLLTTQPLEDDVTKEEVIEALNEVLGIRPLTDVSGADYTSSKLVADSVHRQTITTGDYARSFLQSQFRTEQATQRIEAGQDNLDEAELAALILAGLPAEAIADAIEAGPLVDAVRDELNRRLDA